MHAVGTAASSRGVATALKRRRPGLRAFAVEPAESSVLLGGAPGPHKIEGVGIGYVPPLWDPSVIDEVLAVATAAAKAMARRLAREEARSSPGRPRARTWSPPCASPSGSAQGSRS